MESKHNPNDNKEGKKKILSYEQWIVSGNFWVVREGEYLELYPLISYSCGILLKILTNFIIILQMEMDVSSVVRFILNF